MVKTFTVRGGYVVSRRRQGGRSIRGTGDGDTSVLGQVSSDDEGASPFYIGGGKEGNELLIPLTTAMAGNK